MRRRLSQKVGPVWPTTEVVLTGADKSRRPHNGYVDRAAAVARGPGGDCKRRSWRPPQVPATTCDPMKFQAHDFLDPLIITPEVIRSALEPAIELLDLYMAGKYAGTDISGPVAMAAAQDAREFLSANYPNLQFQLEVDMTQLREGEIKFVIDIKGVRF